MIVGIDVRPALFGGTGFGRVVRETWRALRSRPGVEVRGYGAAWRRPEPGRELDGVRTPRWPARVQRALAPLGFGVETLLGRLDVYHHTDLVYAPVARTPQVMSLHDVVFLEDAGWHDPGFAARVAPRVAAAVRRSVAVVVPCDRVARDLVRRDVAPADGIHVVPLGADHVDGAPAAGDADVVARLLAAAGVRREDGEPLVLVPGTREPRKNQRALLDAFLELASRRPGVLLFVGPRGWGCDELEDRLAALAADRTEPGRRVGVAGPVSDAELASLLRTADVVAYPSLAEGFGLPVAEAMVCGRAVLTSSGTPMADFGGDAVLSVDPRDGSALRDGLAELLGNDAARRELGARARDVIAPFTWAAHAEALEAVYRVALS